MSRNLKTPASDSPVVSAIITTRNEAPVIQTLLRSLRSQTNPHLEVILVDNFSTDETAQLAQPYVDRLILAGPERSAQRNRGAREAAGQLLMFLDADMRLEPGVVAEAAQLFASQPGVRLAAVPERSTGRNYWARAKALERNCYVDEPAVMAARFYARDVFWEQGGYDESLNGGEDWDLSQRARGAGPLPVLTACLWHDEGQIALGPQMRKKFYYARDFARYARKHPRQARSQLNLLFRPAYLRHWRELAQQPQLAAGMFALRLMEGMAGVAGIAYQAYANRQPGAPQK